MKVICFPRQMGKMKQEKTKRCKQMFYDPRFYDGHRCINTIHKDGYCKECYNEKKRLKHE